jgi:hypothetical protein
MPLLLREVDLQVLLLGPECVPTRRSSVFGCITAN